MYLYRFLTLLSVFFYVPFLLGITFDPLLRLNNEINFRTHVKPPFGTFIFSTELNLATAKPILEQAPSGLAITVGSERGFNTIALTKNATHALMLDYDYDIIRYNRITLELLKSSSLKEHRNLRWEADFKGWMDFKKNNSKYKIMLTKDDFLWWKKHVREGKGLWNNLSENLSRYGKDVFFERFSAIYSALSNYLKMNQIPREALLYPEKLSDWTSRGITLNEADFQWWQANVTKSKELGSWMMPGPSMVGQPDFNGVLFDWSSIFDAQAGNFLNNEALYNRLHELSINNKIALCRLDLANVEHQNKLLQAITKSQIPIGLLDLDNIWWFGYLGRTDTYHSLVNRLVPLGQDHSILLTMVVMDYVRNIDLQLYVGFAFNNVKTWPADFRMGRFFDQAKPVLPLLHGRVYYGNNMPRWQHLAW